MRCPICGSKMFTACAYCKITADQVENASNKQVAKARKQGEKSKIVYTSTLPKDVNGMRLLLLTIFFGWCGVGNFYVKKNIKGIFNVLSFFICLLFYSIKFMMSKDLGLVFQFFYELSIYVCAINFVLWIWDIIALLCKTYKIPVVLGEKPEQDNKKTIKGKKRK